MWRWLIEALAVAAKDLRTLMAEDLIERIEQDGAGTVFEAQPRVACSECGPDSETDAEGRPLAERVLDERNRYLMYSMMQDVITRGTARRSRVLGSQDLAGKTGTTNDQRDAWFNGYNRSLVTIA